MLFSKIVFFINILFSGTSKPYSCPVCFTPFSRKYHLVRHNMQTGCDGSERPKFPCQVNSVFFV